MIETKDLVLVVKEQKLGELVTNAKEIKAFVEARLIDYTPENYVGKADEAKKDRAELNKASKELNDKRKTLEKEFMRPFDEFKSIIKETTDAITSASGKLDEIVKAEEEREKALKRENIDLYWSGKKFTLVSLDRVFDQKWLNKTTKLSDVRSEIDSRIEAIYADVKTLEAMEDADVLKQLYLDTLDIGSALRKGQELKEYRHRLETEAKERAEREARDHIRKQEAEIQEEQTKPVEPENLAAEALGIPVDSDPEMVYTLRFFARKSVLLSLRKYMTENGIQYEKLEGGDK